MSRILPLAFAVAALSAAPAFAQKAGVIASVNQNAKGTPPGASTRVLALGADVLQRERVDTDANGTAQISLADRSTMNIGRNASVVIDRFVYDNARGAGEMAASLTRGALRFVGGQISHTSGAAIRTPAATIGVRGGVVTVVAMGDGSVRVISHYGVVSVQNGAGRQVISRSGFETFVAGPNSAPTTPHPVNMAGLQSIMSQMESHGGQRGGARSLPTNTAAAAGGVGLRRPDAATPSFDAPTVLDNIARSHGTTRPFFPTPQTPPPDTCGPDC